MSCTGVVSKLLLVLLHWIWTIQGHTWSLTVATTGETSCHD